MGSVAQDNLRALVLSLRASGFGRELSLLERETLLLALSDDAFDLGENRMTEHDAALVLFDDLEVHPKWPHTSFIAQLVVEGKLPRK